MHDRGKQLALVLAIAAALTLGGTMRNSFGQKASVPRPAPYRNSLDPDEVRQLLLLIGSSDADRITKQQWMNFMEREFDRLDKNKSGEVDAKELAQSRLRVSPFARIRD
ncbi:MAG TPA: hypothetical protein VEJ67_14475 [Candidatus Cybelea sp.]|nr:hypothetical protein [Candidatus Cybelea sp.]